MYSELTKIDVSIKRAKITSIQFHTEDEDLPDVTVCLTLQTAQGKPITNVSLSTKAYYGDTKFSKDDIPAHVFSAIGTCLRELGSVCTRKINAIDKVLEAKIV